MLVTVFRSRLKPEAAQEYGVWANTVLRSAPCSEAQRLLGGDSSLVSGPRFPEEYQEYMVLAPTGRVSWVVANYSG